MTKQEFISQFVTNFLAAYAAKHYEECAIRRDYQKITTNPPIEDALFIAENVWNATGTQQAVNKYLR